MQQIVPNSNPPTVPEDGNYITALNEAGIDPQRIEQLQQSKYFNFHFIIFSVIDINAEEFNIFNQYTQEEIDNFKQIFDMFDTQKTGCVGVKDL